jgi:mRNA-degrading endonuclease RelE of RelBE toxin-antitoxin system
VDVAKPGRVGGKSVKTVRGVADSFHRLRVGDHRVIGSLGISEASGRL